MFGCILKCPFQDLWVRTVVGSFIALIEVPQLPQQHVIYEGSDVIYEGSDWNDAEIFK